MTFGVFSERACSVRMIPSSQAGDILGLWIRPGLGIGGGGLLCVADISHCYLSGEAVGHRLAFSGFVADDLSISAVDFI